MAKPKYGNKGKKRSRPNWDDDEDFRPSASGSRKSRNWKRYDPVEFEEEEEEELVEDEIEYESR